MKHRFLRKSSFLCTSIALTLIASCLLSISLIEPVAWAQEPTLWEKIRRIWRNPQRIGSGTNRQSAGVQDRCPFIPEGSPRLTALVPATENGETYAIEKTVSLRPNFWVYVPYTNQQYRNVEFVLIDQQEEDLYRVQFPLINSDPAILRLQLPETVRIRPGQRYQWVFSILCNPSNRSGDTTVHGWVEQVPVSDELMVALSALDWSQSEEDLVVERTLAYAEAEVWFETLNTLAVAYQQAPDNSELETAWQEFLAEMDLEELIDMPVLPCCQTLEGIASNSPVNATPLEE